MGTGKNPGSCSDSNKINKCMAMTQGYTQVFTCTPSAIGLVRQGSTCSKVGQINKVREIRLLRHPTHSGNWSEADFKDSMWSRLSCKHFTCDGLNKVTAGMAAVHLYQKPEEAAYSAGAIDLMLTKSVTPRACTQQEQDAAANNCNPCNAAQKEAARQACKSFDTKKSTFTYTTDKDKLVSKLANDPGFQSECA